MAPHDRESLAEADMDFAMLALKVVWLIRALEQLPDPMRTAAIREVNDTLTTLSRAFVHTIQEGDA